MSSFDEVLAGLQAITAWQEHVYKQLHAHPELSFQETETAALAASKLNELGYEVLKGIGRTGVVGILRNAEGQTVLAAGRCGTAGHRKGFVERNLYRVISTRRRSRGRCEGDDG